MNEQQKEALRKVIQYLEHDEEKDFLEREPEDRVNHIYTSVIELKNLLKEKEN